MAQWFSVEDSTQQTRLLDAWPDAPLNNLETCGMILSTAREQVIAYAPALDPVDPTGTIVPGPITETRRNHFTNPAVVVLAGFAVTAGQATLSHTGTAARFTVDVSAPTAVGINVVAPAAALTGEAWRMLIRVRCSRPLPVRRRIRATETPTSIVLGGDWQWVDYTAVAGAGAASSSGLVLRDAVGHLVGDWVEIDRVLFARGGDAGDWFDGNAADRTDPATDRTYDFSWLGGENVSASAETYRPDVFVPDPVPVPDRLVYAQLQQARNLWEAGRVSSDGSVGAEGYTFTPRPLDKTIRSIIRPVQGKPHVL